MVVASHTSLGGDLGMIPSRPPHTVPVTDNTKYYYLHMGQNLASIPKVFLNKYSSTNYIKYTIEQRDEVV